MNLDGSCSPPSLVPYACLALSLVYVQKNVRVTNPVYGLPLLHYYYISPRTTVPIIHCTDLTDYTADSHHTPYLSLGLPRPLCRVLFSIYHCDNYFTEPIFSFLSLVILLPVFLRFTYCLAVWILFAPAWTIASDGEVKRSEPVKLSTQLYREKVHYSKLFKTVHAVVIKMNNTFQSAVIHYSCWFHI